MEAIGSTVIFGLALLVGVSYLLTAHSLSVIARKTDHGDTAEILSYIPILQIAPMLWVGGGSVLRFILFSVAFFLANALLLVAAGKMGDGLGAAVQILASVGLFGAMLLYMTILAWRTATARHLPGWVGLLIWIPGVSFFLYPLLAFHDGWASPHKVGGSIGLVACLAMTSPIFLIDTESLLADMQAAQLEQEAAALSSQASTTLTSDIGRLDAMPNEVVSGDPARAGSRAAAMPNAIASDSQIGLDQGRSIRALFELQSQFDTLDRLTTPASLADRANRTRARSVVQVLRTELESMHEDLDPTTYEELATHLVRIEATLHREGPALGKPRGGHVRIARTSRSAGGTGLAPPASPGFPRTEEAAPVRPFPVQVAGACPSGAELRTLQSDEGDEEWCEQLPEYGGLREGWYARYFASGRPEQVGEYRNGLRVGVWTRFYESGAVRAQAEFEGGLQHGWLVSFAENGDRKKAARFDRGARVR